MSDNATRTAAAQDQPSPDRLTLLAFAGFVIFGGGASVAIRYTYGELAPYWSGVMRFGLGALIFWGLTLGRRVSLPRGRGLVGAALFGALSTGLSFIFIYYGLVKTPASLYQTTVAIIPLLTLILATIHGLEKIHARGLVGGLVAVAGIVVALSGSLSAGVDLSLPHMVAIVLGAACFAEAGVVAKYFPRSHPLATNAVAMTVGAVMLLIGSLVSGETWSLPSSTNVWLAFGYIVLGATVTVFLLYLFVLERWTASGASYGFVLVPIVTVILAAVIAGETITLIFLVGAALVLAGVYIGAIQPPPKAEEGPSAELQVRPGLPNCG